MKIQKILADRSNYGGYRKTKDIKYIVLHYTANKNDTDENNALYFQKAGLEASANYFVDPNSVTQSVPDDYIAWSVGGKKYLSCSTSGGGKLYGICKNSNSISIELCSTNGQFSPATIQNALWLVKKLMKQYKIDVDHVIRHFDVTGKECPAYWVGSQRNEMKFYDFKIQLLNLTKISAKSADWIVRWMKFKLKSSGLKEAKNITINSRYDTTTVKCVLAAWKAWGWKTTLKISTGKGVGKSTIKKLLAV